MVWDSTRIVPPEDSNCGYNIVNCRHDVIFSASIFPLLCLVPCFSSTYKLLDHQSDNREKKAFEF